MQGNFVLSLQRGQENSGCDGNDRIGHKGFISTDSRNVKPPPRIQRRLQRQIHGQTNRRVRRPLELNDSHLSYLFV